MNPQNNDQMVNEINYKFITEFLSLADNSKETFRKLTDKISEITGAKIVAIFKKPESFSNGKENYSLVGVCPQKKEVIAKSEIIWSIIKALRSRKKIVLISQESNQKAYDKLSEIGYKNSLIVPLILNNVLFGHYLLLGLPKKTNLKLIVKRLNSLKETITLLFRYSLINDRMEELVKESTDELYETNNELKVKIKKEKREEEKLLLTQFSVDNSTDAVYWIDTYAKFIYVNKRAIKALGYSREELMTMTVHDIDPEFPSKIWPTFWDDLKEKKSCVIHSIHQKKDGSTFPVEITANFIQFAGKEINCAIVKDVTEQNKNEKLIKQKNKQLLLLSKSSIEINKTLDIEIILQKLTKIAVELTESTSGASAIYKNNQMVFKQYFKNGRTKPVNYKFDRGNGVPGWVIKTKRPYLSNDAQNDKHVIKEIRKKLNFNQLIDIPILNKRGDLLGCFEVHNKRDNRLYSENDIELLQGLAANASVAIENAQMLLERNKVEEELTKSESRYRMLFENSLAGVYVATKTGKILDCNNAFASILGYSSKEEILKTDTDIFYQNKKEREIFIKKLITGKELINSESKVKKKDGNYIYIIENVHCVGKNIIQGTVIDITERRQSEKEIKESQQRLSSHLDNTPLAGIFWDIDFKVTDWNVSAENIFGYKKNEALGKHAYELIIPKEIKGKIDDVFNNLLTQTGGHRSTNENITKNGKRILCNWYNVALTDINGKVTGVASLADDITERIKTKNDLTEAKNKAEEMNRIKSNFFANMSHELRTPLVGILGFTEILEESIKDPELKEYVEMINESGQRLLGTLNLILNLSKIESENIEVELSKIDIIKYIKDTIELFKILAAKKNLYIKLVTDIKKFNIEIDGRIFFQIMNNLVNNATKFTIEGGITIFVNKIKNDSYLEIQVKDTGIGIAKEKQKMIWKEFRQVSEGTCRMFEGTGLGLTVTKNFVEKLNGEIKLKSKLGEGSTFIVLLPINKKKLNEMPAKHIVSPEEINTKNAKENKLISTKFDFIPEKRLKLLKNF